MSRTCSSSANAPIPASRNRNAITRGKLRCRRGFAPKQQDVNASHTYLEEENGSTSHDASVLVSSQSVGCEIVWDCVSPGPPVSIHDVDGSSTPGEGIAPRRLRKRSLTQRTPARTLQISAAKAKKSAVLDVKADAALSGAKCTARLLFFKNAVPSHDKDVTPSLVGQDEVEAMDIMELSPIACLSGVEAEVAAADGTAAPSSPPFAAAVTAETPPTTPKMNQSFSCKNSANRGRSSVRIDSFDDDSLFSESIIQSTQAIEEALFDKSKNRFISPAAVSKVLSKIQPGVSDAKGAKVKQCNTPLSHHDNFSKGAKCRTEGMSSSTRTRDVIKSSQKQDSNITVGNLPNHSVETNSRVTNRQKEADKLKVDASHLLSKPLLSNGNKDNLGLLPNNGNVVVNASSVNKRRIQSEVSSGYRSGSSSGGETIRPAASINNKRINEQNSTSKSRFAIGGTAIADKSSITKVATSTGGRNGHNQSKMPRSRSVYSAAGAETTALVAMTTAVRRVNSDSAVLNFSDSDPEFDEIASSIPDNEDMLMPWSQQLLQKTRLKLDRNKNMQQQLSSIQEVLNKSLQRSGGSQGDSHSSPQQPKGVTNNTGLGASRSSTAVLPHQSEIESVSVPPTDAVSPQLLDDADFFDDGFEMEDDVLNNFLSQVEEEYVSASQAVPAAALQQTNNSAEQQLGKTNTADKASKFINRRNCPSSKSDNRNHVDANDTAQINNSGVILHANITKHSNTSTVPLNTAPINRNNPGTNLNTILPSQRVASSTNNKYESTPNKKYSFRNHSSRKDSSDITPKNLADIGHKSVGPAPLNRAQRATTNCTGAEAGIIRSSISVVNNACAGVGYFQPPSSTATQSMSAATMTCSSSSTSGTAAAVLCPAPATSSSKCSVAVTSRVAPSSTSQFTLPISTSIGGGPSSCAAPGNKTKYTKEQIAMKKAQAIERQKALLQRKAKGGAL